MLKQLLGAVGVVITFLLPMVLSTLLYGDGPSGLVMFGVFWLLEVGVLCAIYDYRKKKKRR